MSNFAIGIDLGGTKISTGLIKRDGSILHQSIEPTQAEKGAENIIDRIATSIKKIITEGDSNIDGIGIGVAAMTDSRKGIVILASNLHWKNIPLRNMLCDRLGDAWCAKLFIDKDTNAAVLGEMFYGAGQDALHILYVTVGTGIGGGMVLNGTLYHGASEGASDIGHLVMEPNGSICGCGKRGCLETLASGTAIAQIAQEELQNQSIQTSLRSLQANKITAKEIVEAAKDGDEFSIHILEQAGYWIGRALAYYIDINNPEKIILGGGVMGAGNLLLDPIRKTVNQFALKHNARTAEIVPASLGNNSGIIGAASLVWQNQS